MKKFGISLALLTIVAGLTYWQMSRKTTLPGLQKDYLLAKTAAEKNKVIERLEKYYLDQEIPAALQHRVEEKFAELLEDTKSDLPEFTNVKATNANPYELEGELRKLVKTALVAAAQSEENRFGELMGRAGALAKIVDAGTENDYWVGFVAGVQAYNKSQAEAWLKADLALALCKQYQKSATTFEDAERYGSLGLRLLRQAPDERMRLDFLHCLQYILYHQHSMYELSLGLGEKSLRQSEEIKYHLRSNGLNYYRAETLVLLGENQEALALYDAILEKAMQFKAMPSMEWFAVHGLLGKCAVMLALGELEIASQTLQEVQTHSLTAEDLTLLQILRGMIGTAQGDYEQAEKTLQNALNLANAEKDTFNLVTAWDNLGANFERLTEYGLALDCYLKAKSLLQISVKNINLLMAVLGNITDLAITTNDFKKLDDIIQEYRALLQIVSTPARKARMFSNIGNMYKKTGRFDEAAKNFQEAASIYDKNGLLQPKLKAQIDLVDCLIGQSKLNEAQNLLADIEPIAREIKDVEKIVDAIGRRAKIQKLHGNLALAITTSNRLLGEIEKWRLQIKSRDRQRAFRQKNYDYLKNAASYEIAFQRQDSAFIKLVYAQKYFMKNQPRNSPGDDHATNNHVLQRYIDLAAVSKNLEEKSLVINYMVTSQELHAFLLDQRGVMLVSKKMNVQELHKAVSQYRDLIDKTFDIFGNYDTEAINRHYVATMQVGRKLYDYLLDWPGMESRLQQLENLVIIPDEFLFEVPFAALPGNRSDSIAFLVNRVAVAILPSADFLEHTDTVTYARTLSTMKVLISADESIPGAKDFVRKTKALMPATQELLASDTVFSKQDIIAQFKKDYDAFIFIGHGKANANFPDQGYIELSVKSRMADARKIVRLSMADLKSVDWISTEMVILVGCETAWGKLYRGSGISGLHQTFWALGAHAVLGNLWEVNAQHAIPQAENFLKTLASGDNFLQALRKSQLSVIQKLEGDFFYQKPHPYFWGGSILLNTKSL